MRLDYEAVVHLVSRLRIRGARPPLMFFYNLYRAKIILPYGIEIVTKAHFPDNDVITARNISRCVT